MPKPIFHPDSTVQRRILLKCSSAATEFKSETERHDRVAASVDTQKTTYQLMTDSHYTSSHLTDGLYQTSTLRQLVTGCH